MQSLTAFDAAINALIRKIGPSNAQITGAWCLSFRNDRPETRLPHDICHLITDFLVPKDYKELNCEYSDFSYSTYVYADMYSLTIEYTTQTVVIFFGKLRFSFDFHEGELRVVEIVKMTSDFNHIKIRFHDPENSAMVVYSGNIYFKLAVQPQSEQVIDQKTIYGKLGIASPDWSVAELITEKLSAEVASVVHGNFSLSISFSGAEVWHANGLRYITITFERSFGDDHYFAYDITAERAEDGELEMYFGDDDEGELYSQTLTALTPIINCYI